MQELVPIKIKIQRKVTDSPNGKSAMVNDYPDFNSIDVEIRKNMDWSYYIDQYGGWHYDKECGFGEADEENKNDPHNNPDVTCQYGCLLVPKGFATAALKKFPKRVFELDEAKWEKFHDDRAHAREPEELIDNRVIDAINAKKSLGIKATSRDKDALDPEKPVPGIMKNKKKKWADVKKRRQIAIISTK